MIKEAVFKSFDSTTQLEQQLATSIAAQLQEAIENRGQASLVVSGGSTPLKLFRLLSEQAISWEHVFITLADERWVNIDSADSNEALVRENLLQNRAVNAKFHGLKNTLNSAEEGCELANESLANFPMPFDVVILGMGNDGHTCSWFPCASKEQLLNAFNSTSTCVAVNPTTAAHGRITLTRHAILNSRQIYLHLVGEQKLTVYRQALENNDIDTMPIRAVLSQQKTPVDVYWCA